MIRPPSPPTFDQCVAKCPHMHPAVTDVLFPVPEHLIVPILQGVGNETRFMVVSNLPVYYVWYDILLWLCTAMPCIG